MYRTIVVPLDLTPRAQRAIPYGAALARQAGASLELLTVQPSHVTGDTTRPILADIARRHGVEARLRVAAAPDPAQAIVDAATDAEVLLCLQSHARGAVTELVLSSVSEQVMRACPYPVLLVGPHCGPAPDRFSAMVVALDGSDLAEHILPTAVRWSTDLDVTPWLFQVLDVPVPLEMGRGQARRHLLRPPPGRSTGRPGGQGPVGRGARPAPRRGHQPLRRDATRLADRAHDARPLGPQPCHHRQYRPGRRPPRHRPGAGAPTP